jgi:hypothetical protein
MLPELCSSGRVERKEYHKGYDISIYYLFAYLLISATPWLKQRSRFIWNTPFTIMARCLYDFLIIVWIFGVKGQMSTVPQDMKEEIKIY